MNPTLLSDIAEAPDSPEPQRRLGDAVRPAEAADPRGPADPADLALLERDRSARKAAQTVFDRPLVLQAGAGTGKTTTLVGRLLAWALGPGWEGTAMRRAARAAANPFHQPSPPGLDEEGSASGAENEKTAAELLARVVAITFTEAAAAEMATRTAQELAKIAANGSLPLWLRSADVPASPGERSLRARALLGSLDRLNVRTIHAFCRSLLADHALEAGLHPDLEVDADGTMLEEVVLEVVEDRLRASYGDPGDPDSLALAARGFGPREVAETLIELATQGLPSRALAADPLAPELLAALVGRLGRRCRDLHHLLAPRLPKIKKTAKNAIAVGDGVASLLALLPACGLDLERVRAEVACAFPNNLVDHLKKWRGGLNKSETEVLGDVAEEVARASVRLADLFAHLRRVDPEILGPAYRVLQPLLAAVEEALRVRGISTFDALLTGASDLLADKPQVRTRVRRSIDQLLVDEFQDTDRTQCELLRWLALDGPALERPGLFLVGDPKQSIYGWRKADLRAYDGFIARVVANGGEVLPLAENFRSVPAILDEVTRVVEPVMLPRSGFQPPFERLLTSEAKRGLPGFRRSGEEGQGHWSPVEYWLPWRSDDGSSARRTSASEATAIEAEAIAADLRALHDEQGVPWSEMALLLRSTGDLDDYLEALRRRSVPFAVARDKQYYRRREIIEAAAWVRAVVDPGDHLALVTVLRSTTVGVPDAAFIPLWSRGFPRRLTELTSPDPAALATLKGIVERVAAALPRDIPGLDRIAGWHLNLIAAVETLAQLRADFVTEPADRFVERLRLLTLIEATEAARYLGPYRLANLERFFRQLLASLERSGGDTRALLRTLRRSVAESREAGEGRPQEADGDAVSVLTFHGAKGLDFGHVYLLQLHHRDPARPAGTAFGRIEAEGEGGAERYEARLFGAPTLGFDEVEAERREIEANERVRTLYVGMTRAKERVVLTGSWPVSLEPVPVERAAHYLDLLRSRAGLLGGARALWDERRALHPEVEERWRVEDRTGAVWKLPALRQVEAAPPAPEPEKAEAQPDLPDSRSEAKRARDLAAQRAEARGRMERPFRATASHETHTELREAQAAELSGGEDWEIERSNFGPQGIWTGARVPKPPLPPEPEGAAPAPEPGAPEAESGFERATAMAAGGALHRALETWDLEAEPEVEAARQIALLPTYLAALAGGEIRTAALAPAKTLIEEFWRGPLLPRLRALGDRIVARELPVVAGPPAEEGSPVGAVVGTVDLLYRDESGAFVIADYKTDLLETDQEHAARGEAYALQGGVYLQAIREALELEEDPKFELWFVRSGRVVEG